MAEEEKSRTEWLDGETFEMAEESSLHQRACEELARGLSKLGREGALSVRVQAHPGRVQLDEEGRFVAWPDLCLVLSGEEGPREEKEEGICEEKEAGTWEGKTLGEGMKEGAFEGKAPQLILEVLSSDTRMKDLYLKPYVYQKAGVLQYLICDLVKAEILSYDLRRQELFPERFSFEECLPVWVLGEGVSLDLKEVLGSWLPD